MSVSPAKENILKKIREALAHTTPLPFPKSEGAESVFKPSQQDLEVEFAEQFSSLQGRFVFCINKQELAFQLGSLIRKMNWQKVFCVEEPLVREFNVAFGDALTQEGLASCDAAVTGCEFLVSRTGSIVLSSAQPSGRGTSVYAPVHICIAYTDQLVYDIKDALSLVKGKYGEAFPSLVTFATGPSRTADIEKTLVVGVHGPKEVYVFLVDS